VIEEHLGPNAQRIRKLPQFRMEIIEGPDHTFTPLAARRVLFKRIESYMLDHFG